ncbi:helix-turn-helix domain-containing protein [Halobacillus litoralis]|uniref:Helix-turn-helix domain-containing protein n=2 Tax=Halobacillus litoralis TaxID=45668 RepID=A0A845DPW6_9BACI|nr:helix-turn-helix domain-containing protein [Halobacillus litoralis]MYL37664.1 helix-turn-helix domain-containing protein [Halobacillus litoralis]
MVLHMEIGARLKEAREAKGLSLEDLQETTKIQKRYLQAIEKNDFQVLPGKFYTRAFIREYASAVGLDPEQVMEEHKNELPTYEEENTVQFSRVQKSKQEAAQKSRGSSRFLPTFLTVGLVVGLILVFWIFMQSGSDENGAPADSSSSDEISVPAGSEGSGSEDPANDEEEQEESGEGSGAQEDAVEETEEDSAEEPEEEGTGVELSEEGSGSFPMHTYEVSPADDSEVTVEFSGNVYMEVQSPQGGENLVTPREYTSSDSPVTIDIGDKQELYIKTGNAPGMTVKVDDQPVTFPDPELTTQKLLLQLKE